MDAQHPAHHGLAEPQPDAESHWYADFIPEPDTFGQYYTKRGTVGVVNNYRAAHPAPDQHEPPAAG